MKRSLTIIPLIFVMFSCEPREELFPVPHYMYERFETNEPCSEVSYFRLHFPDSTVFVADTMRTVQIGRRGTGPGSENIMGASLRWCDFKCDYLRVSLSFQDTEPIDNRYNFSLPGSYKFFDSQRRDTQGVAESTGVELSFNRSFLWYNSMPRSAFFFILGRQKNSKGNQICGEFDVLLGPDSVRVTGDYSLLFID
jgi:hypothetical protein